VARKDRIRVENLARLMTYMLGHRPDEFGLIPDREGFVPIKELLQAIHEEAGWGYVRQGHINEVLLGTERSLFQPEEKRIRAVARRWHLALDRPAQTIPRILFTPVRRRAHPHAMQKGLRSGQAKHIVLSPEKEMAARLGKQRDQRPIVLEVLAAAAGEAGLTFYGFGDLYLTAEIPPKYIAGPPPSREDLKTLEAAAKKREQPQEQPLAGGFVLSPERDPDVSRRAKGRKERGWKEASRRQRRQRGSEKE
jgi:putative RNA 2'-phosphotransferase